MENMTTLMLPDTEVNSTTIDTISKPGLMTIPREIRNEIWRMLLTTSYAFKEPTNGGDREAHYELQPAILRVNRRIYHETRAILRAGNMWIVLCIAMPKKPICYVDETAHLPVFSRSGPSEDFNEIKQNCLGIDARALDVVLYPEHNFQNDDYTYHIMIMGPESMPYFLQLMSAMVYVHRSVQTPPRTKMEMHVGTPFCFTHSRLQKEILEPFLAVRGIQTIIINGNVDENFANFLMDKMGSQWACTTEILDLSETFLKKGDAAAAAGLMKAASFHYEQGSRFTFFAGQSYIDKFDVRAANVCNSVRIGSMLNAFDVRWAKVLLKLRYYADVLHLRVSVIVRHGQARVTATEQVQLTLCSALAWLGLGESTQFRDIMSYLFNEGLYDWKVSHTGHEWTYCWHRRDVFPDDQSMAETKDAIGKDLGKLMKYCNEGEEGGLRRINTDGFSLVLRGQVEFEFPSARGWSAIATRYLHRRKIWARNRSIEDRFSIEDIPRG